MCGIVGYIGSKQAQEVLLEGLKRMEYRGYDSAGVAIVNEESIESCKKAGKLRNLTQALEAQSITGTVGIGHTRWATHGAPTDENAHPHTDCQNEIYLVHNGIIENCDALREQLEELGHTFVTETDTEVLTHLIEMEFEGVDDLETAVQRALQKVVGAYGIAVVSTKDPEKIVAARLGSPLVLGVVGEGEFIIASDVTALIQYTRDVVYLDEGEMVVVTPQGHHIKTLDNKMVNRDPNTVDWDVAQAEKEGYDHFMLKEIMEQPKVLLDGMRGRLVESEGISHLGGFNEQATKWQEVERIILVACGTASFAAEVGRYMIEEYAGIPAQVEIGSEFRYKKPYMNGNTAVVVVSQSGETADTIASMREAKRQGALTFGIVNVVGSTIAREVDGGAYIHAGPEVAVASTKAFVGMLNLFAQFTLALARQRMMSSTEGQKLARALQELPEQVQSILDNAKQIEKIAKRYAKYDHAFYLGRKYNYGIAREGALKLKEISYVHAEGVHTGELKHGPLALIDDRFYSVFIAPKDSVHEKNVSNVQELKARSGRAIVVATEGDKTFNKLADDVLYIPKTVEALTPILATIPLQLFAYYIAVERGCDVDQPRNLAKSVTVE